MKLKPLGDHVVIRPLEAEDRTPGGIVLPDTAKEKSTKGEVVAVGSGKVLPNGRVVPLSVKEGDKVLYSKYAGSEVKIDGKEYKIVTESEILAVLE
ncbi:MAG TPA: co-chaperone GroES [Planctomycetota bacterium]|jgi:chaperonin GroES|nr:co-chaperone GroES [Planctomycetota bacterium]